MNVQYEFELGRICEYVKPWTRRDSNTGPLAHESCVLLLHHVSSTSLHYNHINKINIGV
jgi:hypothetical protein